MLNRLIPLIFGLLATATTAACTAPTSDDAASSDEEISSARNRDVQVLKVYDASSFSLSKGSIYPALDQEQCKPEGATWKEIKDHDYPAGGYMPVKLDCTDAFTKKYGLPTMRAVTGAGYRTRKDQEQAYGYVGFNNGEGGYFVKTVELVVKQTVIDSPSFNGIGFYLNAFQYAYYVPAPAPGADNGNGYFLFADQVRAQANTYPATTLSTGEQARVIKVLLPFPTATGGSSYVQAFYFRPFAEFVAGSDKHQRWDAVTTDYFVRYDTSFNREGEILKH